MDVIDIDTDHAGTASDFSFSNPQLSVSNLSRSMSQLSATQPLTPAQQQAAAAASASSSSSSHMYASSPLPPSSSSSSARPAQPFNFGPSDLEESTFFIPTTSLLYQQTGNSIALPSLDRGLSTMSSSSFNGGAGGGFSGFEGGAGSDEYSIPVPFTPLRESTGQSLPPFDDAVGVSGGYGGGMTESSAYDGNQMAAVYAQQMQQQQQESSQQQQHQLYLHHLQQQQLKQQQQHSLSALPLQQQSQLSQGKAAYSASPAPSSSQLSSAALPASSSPYPNLNLDLVAPAPVAATTLSSTEYDPTRKRQRGDVDNSSLTPIAPYYLEPSSHPYYGMMPSKPPVAAAAVLPSASPALTATLSAPQSTRIVSTPQPSVGIPAGIPGRLQATLSSPGITAGSASPASVGPSNFVLPARVQTAPGRGRSAADGAALPASTALSSSSSSASLASSAVVPVTKSASTAAAASSPSSSALIGDDYDVSSSRDSESPSGGGEDREVQKKVKHQLTDRQRRAKIKDSMDQLKALLPLDTTQKADQATIVAESVDMIKGMKDEMQSLRSKIAELELTAKEGGSAAGDDSGKELSAATRKLMLQQSYASSSPFSAMMASLNGAGVSMWRLGLDGRVLEVNLVFEMVTGFSGAEVVNRSPCSAPLYGSLSVMPKSFLRYFSTVSAAVSSPSIADMTAPSSPASTTSSSSAASSPSSPVEGAGGDSPSFSAASPPQRVASAASPLFSNVTISSLPIVPHSELQSFFPFKCKTLDMASASASSPAAPSSVTAGGMLPHGQYLMNHLSNLPPNHVLKLLSRVSTSYGDTLESIQTMCLVRSSSGQPDYILCLTTPDGRRLVKPTKFLAAGFPQTVVGGGLVGNAVTPGGQQPMVV